MSTIDKMIREAVANGLVEMTLRPCAPMGSWQAIAKYKGREDGPWNVGVAPDLPNAIVGALAGVAESAEDDGIFG